MASSVAGHRRAFGTDTVPGLYEDLELADLVVLTGSNLGWCHPVLYQRLVAAKAARPEMKVVVIDPRRTATCDIADLHLALAPGADAALFNALLAEIDTRGLRDAAFAGRVDGYEAALEAARVGDVAMTGLAATELQQFFDLWCGTTKVVTVYSQGINQSESGTDKVNAILNCHLATGRIGKPGMGPFSVTGQPNAMGGREVGGLANMLACHLEIENPEHRAAVQGFWASPTMVQKPGLKAVDMFRAVEDGQIKALWIICTNPAVSMPDADRVAAAIAACNFVVVSDMMAETDTTKLADVLLPATGWGEKDGTVTNSERRISRQRALFSAPGQARADWRILADVGARMGWGAAFGWASAAEIFAEYAALSGVAGRLGSDFDISGVDADYDAMSPFLWPQSAAKQGGRFFGDGQFHHAGGRARMLPITARGPMVALTAAHPYRLNSGRIRDQWHSMTRTGLSPRLGQHLGEPFVEIHPQDAEGLGIEAADLVTVSNAHGHAILRAVITDRVAVGQAFAPMHWTQETAAVARVNAVVPGITDPVSGQPESKAAAVAMQRFAADWYGFAVTSAPLAKPDCAYWSKVPVRGGWRLELAGNGVPADWIAYARQLFGLPDAQAASVIDPARGLARVAFHAGGRLIAALFIGPQPVALARDHVVAVLGQDDGAAVLAGVPAGDRPDPGPTICACLNVGVNTIRNAIESGAALSVAALGDALGAGTSCGSCRPELAALITRFRQREAAE